jgi:predicted MPP superfamily phosphohydrolase
MPTLAWMTDVHLNFLEPEEREAFLRDVAARPCDAVLVTGDLAEAPSLEAHLAAMERALARPIYFVLGNHDFYRGSIRDVRARMRALGAGSRYVRYLPDAGVVELGADTALIGVDGWGDGRLGNAARSPVLLNDFVHIKELAFLPTDERLARLAALGDEARDQLRALLPAALARHKRVVLATHVPPFREACWHEGRISDDDWLPYFTCAAVGEYLREAMAARPDRAVLVLCGHTHGGGEAQLLPNLRVLTGGAEYGSPALQTPVAIPW